MDPTVALLVIAALLVATLGAGLLLRRSRGRRRPVDAGEIVDPVPLGADGLGERATLLQFSTELCSRCPGMHRTLSAIAAGRPGVRHLDVDLTHRPDIAKQFHVLQTPTTLLLDRDGRVRTRFGGVPGRDVLELELSRIAEEAPHG
ncbi:MAG: thioredoxin family protein [Microbacterium sp.]